VSEWSELHLVPPVAANLAALGWLPAEPRVRDITPVTARGHNAVIVAPPAPAWSGPPVAGALSHLIAQGQGRLLVVCPPDALGEWSAQVAALASNTPLRLVAARGPSRATRLLRADAVDVLILSSDIALDLLGRSALKTETLTSLVLAWPERWANDELLTLLMQDLPRDSQRVILTGDVAVASDLGERYARRAVSAGLTDALETAGPVRTVAVSWERRVAAVADLVELLDPAQLTVWTIDTRLHSVLATALAGAAPGAPVTTRVPEAAAGTILALDLPDAATLRGLLAAGEVILMIPPGADRWVASLAAPRRPLKLPGILDGAAVEVRLRRQTVSRMIEEMDPTAASLVLAPLLERYEAPAVAAALYELWSRKGPAVAEGPAPTVSGTAKLWIGAGRRDEVGPNELVAFLTRDAAVDKQWIGKIEVKETFTLVEVPQAEAERIAQAISGKSLRRRRLVARVDRGPTPGGGRPPRGRE